MRYFLTKSKVLFKGVDLCWLLLQQMHWEEFNFVKYLWKLHLFRNFEIRFLMSITEKKFDDYLSAS